MIRRYGWPVAALLLFLLAALPQLELPGLYYDEALDALPAVELLRGERPTTVANLQLAGRAWPLMILSYVGPTSTYLLLPLFTLTGVGVFQLRLLTVVLGVVSLALLYRACREISSSWVAGAAVLLLATHPSFVAWARTGIYVSFPLVPLAVVTAWMGYRWLQEGRARDLWLASAAAGAGLATKVLFVWLLAGLGVAAVRARAGGSVLNRLRRPGHVAPAAVLLMVGAAPLVIYNLLEAGTLRTLQANLVRSQLYGVSNLAVVANLLTRLRNVAELLSGSWVSIQGGAGGNWLLAAVGTAAVAWGWRRQDPALRYLVGLVVTVFGLSVFTLSALNPPHLLVLLPFLLWLVAAWLRDWPPRRRTATLALLVGINLAVLGTFHLNLARSGGRGWFSDAIYDAARFLTERHPSRVAAIDWGLSRNLALLTRLEVRPLEIFNYGPPDEEYGRWVELLMAEEGTIFLAHADPWTAFFGHRSLLETMARERHRRVVEAASFRQRDGSPVIQALRVEPQPPLRELPPEARPRQVSLGESIHLQGFTWACGSTGGGPAVELTLFWSASRPVKAPYTVFTHLVTGDGRMVAQHDGPPAHGWYGTERWQPEEIVRDVHRLQLPPDRPVEPLYLLVGMYEPATVERLPARVGRERVPGDAVLLAELARQETACR